MSSSKIPGLTYIQPYIPHEDQGEFIKQIDAEPWLTELRRRVQHYGYKYDYRARVIDESMRLGELPAWGKSLAKRLHQDRFFDTLPDQLIVNEYEPGHGIAPHVDCVPCFGKAIASVSLGSSCLMEFHHLDSDNVERLWLEPGSLLIMQGAARYDWKHGIPARKTDTLKGHKIRRSRRLSITFRCVVSS